MNVHPALILGLIAASVLGWVTQAGAEPVPIRVLAKGALSGFYEPTQEVVKDKAAWEKLWARHNTQHLGTTPMPDVNFSKDMVVFVGLGRKNTGGYSIHITQIEPVGGKLRIFVQRKAPPPGGIAIQVITSPFEMVAIPHSDLPPEFVDAQGSQGAQRPAPAPKP